MLFRPVLFAWWLLFGATVCMAAAAWWLLGREADRVESLAASTLANRTATVAESIDLLMEAVRGGVVDGLLSAGESPDPRRALAGLVEGNPYLAAGFYFRDADAVTIWFGERGQLPAPGSILQGAEATKPVYPWTLPEFESERLPSAAPSSPASQRFDAAQAPSDVYARGALEDSESGAVQLGAAAEEVPERLSQSLTQNIALKEQRAAVRQVNAENQLSLSRRFRSTEAEAPTADAPSEKELTESFLPSAAFVDDSDELAVDSAPPVAEPALADTPIRQGWLRPEVAGEAQWLAWMGLPDGSDYLGAWLDREAIVAELSKAIYLSQQDGMHFRLIDGDGRVVAGDFGPRYGSTVPAEPELSIAVGSRLPNWRIETYRANSVNAFGPSFRWVGGLFIAGLSLAILTGASVLIWQARRDAREAELKTTFVANVSHELKTPLTSIRLFADMLYDGRVKDEVKQRQYLQTMVNETQRLTRLVNNVLDFSRLERGQHSLRADDFDLKATVTAIVEAQQDRLQADGLSVSIDGPEEAIPVHLDRDALEQILLNLLDNAAKYAVSGERAVVTIRPEDDGCCLEVRDFGPGIPLSERKQVFAAFHRADDRLTAERPGCGLGLSIAARLAREMGGRLMLEANQPSGCVFILKFHACT